MVSSESWVAQKEFPDYKTWVDDLKRDFDTRGFGWHRKSRSLGFISARFVPSSDWRKDLTLPDHAVYGLEKMVWRFRSYSGINAEDVQSVPVRVVRSLANMLF